MLSASHLIFTSGFSGVITSFDLENTALDINLNFVTCFFSYFPPLAG